MEVLQNCVIYNDKAHAYISDKALKEDRQLIVEHGKPMIYGVERNKGLVLDGLKLKTVTIGENGITEADILVHDAHDPDPVLHQMLVSLTFPEFPVVLGVIRAVESETYDQKFYRQIEEIKSTSNKKSVQDLLYSGNVWKVE